MIKKPSVEKTEKTEKTEISSMRSTRVAKMPSAGYGEEVTPPCKDFKEEKQVTQTYDLSVMQQTGTPMSNKEFASLQDQITHLPHFHGFICREDLGVLLKKPGDWLIRVSVLSEKPKKKKKEVVIGTKEKTKEKEKKEKKKDKNQKFFVVSVYCSAFSDKNIQGKRFRQETKRTSRLRCSATWSSGTSTGKC